jgi:hypothetical protein
MVVEGLSPTTENKDRIEKAAAYLHYPTIKEFCMLTLADGTLSIIIG